MRLRATRLSAIAHAARLFVFGPPLDSLSAAAAYSTRKLRTDYTGPALRVRRSLDNAEADIGFVNNELDTTALMDFVGYENLLTFSEQFENAAWEGLASSAETIAVNSEVAPNGTMTADRCTVIGASSGRYQNLTLPSAGQVTLSTYIKRGSQGTWARIGIYDTPNPGNQVRCWLNMQTGVLGTVEAVGAGWSGVTAEATSVGNDWYRVVVTATCTTTAISALIVNASANNSTIRVTGDNRILWGAQINQGATAQTYSPTSKRNLLTFTEEFDNAAWGKSAGATITADTTIAPDGTLTADRLDCNLVATSLSLNQAVTTTVASGDTWTASVWVKNASSGMLFRVFRLGGGTAESSSISIPESSAWQRISVTHTFGNAHTGVRFDIVAPTGVSSVELWGAQLELGSTATEYQRVASAWSATRDGNGFGTTWYDQSGNARNATQTTAGNQPQIVTGGVVNLLNGKPTLTPAGGAINLNATLALATPYSINTVANRTSGSSYQRLITSTPDAVFLIGALFGNYISAIGNGTAWSDISVVNNPVTAIGSTPRVLTNIATTSLMTPYIDGAVMAGRTGSIGTSTELMLFGRGTQSWIGNCPEVVVFTSALTTTDRQTLERNQGAYFGIPVS